MITCTICKKKATAEDTWPSYKIKLPKEISQRNREEIKGYKSLTGKVYVCSECLSQEVLFEKTMNLILKREEA
jgi:hypothetical protein